MKLKLGKFEIEVDDSSEFPVILLAFAGLVGTGTLLTIILLAVIGSNQHENNEDCVYSSWDGCNPQRYMGEETWQIGEKFAGEFMSGIVTDIYGSIDENLYIEVDGKIALSIPNHAIQRIYYGEG